MDVSAVGGTPIAQFQRPMRAVGHPVAGPETPGLGTPQAGPNAPQSPTTAQVNARTDRTIAGPPAQQDYSRIGFALAASGAFGTLASQLGLANPAAVAARYQQAQALIVRPVEPAPASGMR